MSTETILIGHWEKTWRAPSSAIPEANHGFAFSGWADTAKAIEASNCVLQRLSGKKIITIGGGNSNGRWTAAVLQQVRSAIEQRSLQDYAGIAFDVEEGDAGLSTSFLSTFSKAKAAGLMVVVTTSQTAPYAVSDAAQLIRSFLQCSDIDIMSPQLYGAIPDTTAIDTTPHASVPWVMWSDARSSIVPTIARKNLFPQAKQFLAEQGISAKGYIVWFS